MSDLDIFSKVVQTVMAESERNGSVTIPECGCVVEPDGQCEHGNESPLLTAGLI